MPAELAAGRLAARWAKRPSRPLRWAKPSRRRCRSVGTRAIKSPIASTIEATTAGMSVNASGAGPAKRPKCRPKPHTMIATT